MTSKPSSPGPLRALLATIAAAALIAGCSSSDNPTAGGATSGSTASGATASGAASTTKAATTTASGATGITAISISAGNNAAAVLAANTADGAAKAIAAAQTAVIPVMLSGTTGSSTGIGVKVDGNVIKLTEAATYKLSGTLSNGQVVVDVGGSGVVKVILDGVSITSSSGAALAILNAQEAVIELAAGTTSTLVDAATYTFKDATVTEPNAALFSKADLAIIGKGTLNVTGNFNDAIASKDDLVIHDATIVAKAKDDAIRGKDLVVATSATLTLTAGGDGIKSDTTDDAMLGYVSLSGGTVRITAADDGIDAATDIVIVGAALDVTAGTSTTKSASGNGSANAMDANVAIVVDSGTIKLQAADDALHSGKAIAIDGGAITIATGDDAMHADANLTINGGTVNITKSYEGLESAALTIAGGDITVVASDDGVNGAGGVDGSGTSGASGKDTFATGTNALTISGGTLRVTAEGDGLDINGSITMSAGTVLVNGPTQQMNSAIDYDSTFTITGGVIVGTGSAGMAMAPTGTSAQKSLLATFTTQAAGTAVHIQAADGTPIVTFVPAKAFESIAVSTSAIAEGVTYQVLLGGTASGANAFGLFDAAAYTGGTKVAETTTASANARAAGGPGARPAR